MRGIEKGDKVILTWSEGAFDGKCVLEGTVRSMPSDVGDLIYIFDSKGRIHGVNPMCATFEGIVQVMEKDNA